MSEREAHLPVPARSRRRRAVRLTILISVTVMVGALLVPGSAFGVARVQTLLNGGTLSVRSGDGCALKPAPPGGGRQLLRNFVCVIKNGKPGAVPVSPSAPLVQVMNNGDTLAVVSGDGCKLRPAPPTSGRRYVRNFTCTSKGGTTTPPPDPGTGQPPTGVTGGATWRSIWADEFSGTAVDTKKWNVANKSNFGSGNSEDECYKSANTTVTGGTLRLVGKRQTVTGCGTNPDGGSSYFFTSGLVTTRAQDGPLKFKFRTGYAEVRMRVPRGNIYWPAFWLAGAEDGSSPGWPAYGEVDVTEIYGSRPDVSESNFHRSGGDIGARNHNVNDKASSSTGVNINPPNAFVAGGTNSWHTYGINWTADRLDWYIDGIKVRTYNASGSADLSALSYEHSIILNLAMGGAGPRSPEHGYTGKESGSGYSDGNLVADLPGTMEVDYVRVWQP
jgi:beta-glucanase (GH16 family)